MFESRGIERLSKWKEFRNTLEFSQTPFEDIAEFWSRAPFVSPYLDPSVPDSWPDPWHLVLDDKLDDLAIVLGMLYTIKLTQRFMDSVCEIHMSIDEKTKECRYFLVIDNEFVLNFEYKEVKSISCLSKISTSLLITIKSLQ